MEDNSPYQASRVTPVAAKRDWRDVPPREITSPIKHMCILLVIGAILGVISTVGMMLSGMANAFLLIILGVSTLFYAATAFGVYKGSRVTACAVLVICAFGILGTLMNLSTGQGSLTGVGFMAVLTFVSIRGTLATFRYHRHLRDVRSRPPRSRLSDDPAFAPKADTAL
jgi:hypothetical protein